jgi:hypothetical protein
MATIYEISCGRATSIYAIMRRQLHGEILERGWYPDIEHTIKKVKGVKDYNEIDGIRLVYPAGATVSLISFILMNYGNF